MTQTERNAARRAAYRNFQTAVKKRADRLVLCEVEPATACPARCRFCPRDALTRPQGQMAPATAEAIARGLTPSPPLALLLSGLGEPTRHPGLAELVRIFKDHFNGLVGIVSNAAGLTPALTEDLLASGTDFFHVSMHSNTPETAARITPGLDFQQAAANTETLIALAGQEAIVAINHVMTPENRHETQAINRRWLDLGASWVYQAPAHNRGGFLHSRNGERQRSQCWIYEHTLFVTWAGKVLSCCHDLTGSRDYGNMAHQSFIQIQRQKTEMKQQALHSRMCRLCDFFMAE